MHMNILKQLLAIFIGIFCFASYSFAELELEVKFYGYFHTIYFKPYDGPIIETLTLLNSSSLITVRALIDSSAGIESVRASVFPTNYEEYLYESSSFDGHKVFEFICPPFKQSGSYTITISAEDKKGNKMYNSDVRFIINQIGSWCLVTSYVPYLTKGNIDGKNYVNLADVIIALKVLASLNTDGLVRSDYAASSADVNGDGKVGIEELVYILQKISLLR